MNIKLTESTQWYNIPVVVELPEAKLLTAQTPYHTDLKEDVNIPNPNDVRKLVLNGLQAL